MEPGIDLVERVAAALGTTAADLLPTESRPDPRPVIRGQAERMPAELVRVGTADAFARLNPLLALDLENAARRS